MVGVEGVGHAHLTGMISNSLEGTPAMPVKVWSISVSLLMMQTCWPPAEDAIRQYSGVASEFGLTVSTIKTKFLVVECGVKEVELLPIIVDGGHIECVTEFPYQGSLIVANG